MLPMVEGHVAVICVAVAALALTAAALGIVGEATTKSKAMRARPRFPLLAVADGYLTERRLTNIYRWWCSLLSGTTGRTACT